MTSLPQPSLCERCKVLEFNDSEFGWKEGTEDDGFYLDYLTLSHSFDLEYRLEDSLPDMPVLRTSSRRGCDFCSLLLTVLNEQDFRTWSTLSATMSYIRKTTNGITNKSLRDSLGLVGLAVNLDLAAGDSGTPRYKYSNYANFHLSAQNVLVFQH